MEPYHYERHFLSVIHCNQMLENNSMTHFIKRKGK